MQAKNLNILINIFRTVLVLPDEIEVESVRQVSTERWDSMAHVNMIVAIENEFGLSLHAGEYSRMTSFNSIVLLLDEKGL
tara:strand:+ start:787 stop:1026 length:240 start_codon:yes stop_codon:yes gene_type:complete